MARPRFTGLTVMGVSAQWEFVESERDVARELVYFLEDRRVLFGRRHMEDEYQCVRSVMEIRRSISGLLSRTSERSQLTASLRAIRAACRDFLSAAGPDGRSFHAQGFIYPGGDEFSDALAALRTKVGIQVALIGNFYDDLDISVDLQEIMPPPATEDDGIAWIEGQLR